MHDCTLYIKHKSRTWYSVGSEWMPLLHFDIGCWYDAILNYVDGKFQMQGESAQRLDLKKLYHEIVTKEVRFSRGIFGNSFGVVSDMKIARIKPVENEMVEVTIRFYLDKNGLK